MAVHVKDALDPAFHRRQGGVQRAGWTILAGILVLTGLGVFGDGPLADATAQAELVGGRVKVDYERFDRLEHISPLFVRVDAPAAQGDRISVIFPKEFVDRNRVRGSAPDPDSTEVGAQGVVYTYQVEHWSQPFTISFEVYPQQAGRLSYPVSVQVGDGAPVPVELRQLVYP